MLSKRTQQKENNGLIFKGLLVKNLPVLSYLLADADSELISLPKADAGGANKAPL
jgi:hypothetical protein